MYDYAINRRWSDQYLPEVKRIVGAQLLQAAPDDLDMKHATDLLTLDARDMRIAARIRRPGFADRYPYEFTIRSSVPSGAETELAKIVNGYADWMFYGHAAPDGSLASWWLIDLRAFRAALIRRAHGSLSSGEVWNRDGSSFRWFDIRSFPSQPPLVVAASAFPAAGLRRTP
ncbi:hypothetical protein [Alloyangia pacifica]|uniref:hypothetical protein n=1 Tax=Alloyangia pacifica TaxID=311180 RepID=UPI0031D24C62